ncbi:MAG: DUF3053 domain-containing protein [Deltaproteobacteria bacterium]|jgi:hypothetical protein|nr:DUF3053 domain-containing protein [Deltaproteobacteria bacterium]
MMPLNPSLRLLCLGLLILCFSFASACRKQEQEQRKTFIDFLEMNILAAADANLVQMSDETRKKVGIYGKHFDVIATYSRELGDVNARLAGEKTRIAALGPVSMDKLGSERARLEQIVAACSRSVQHIEVIRAKADAAKAALKQPEDVQAVFARAYEKEVSGFAAASRVLCSVQRDFYAEALRMCVFLERHKEKIQIKNKTVTIEEQALLQEYNVLQKVLEEKSQKMQAALAYVNHIEE